MDTLTANHIVGWLACAAFLVILINGGFRLARNVKGDQPTPPNSNLGLSVAELNRRVRDLEEWRGDLIEKMDTDKADLLAAGEERARRIYRHVDEVRAEIGTTVDSIRGTMISGIKDVERAIGRLEGKIDKS
jgi:hypothetical protein